ncbi:MULTISPECIES: DUF4190 domain-containing protein [unclassified Isoptericola]|uniref:DUF4190 domain-containing protein n=1 Tax=unclassified Isoptericola TaxID=2623355 RepID=UPI0027138EC9|nr:MULTISPECIES: DUF4190 domain-containing protein [unclassified Isoptericola]MDO8149130.1 DUF4190 domain-containing protein [Isoptericola sp. b515]MDO8150925.1 DUF4190 domain-containing protein [Isoptericola sp. b408]
MSTPHDDSNAPHRDEPPRPDRHDTEHHDADRRDAGRYDAGHQQPYAAQGAPAAPYAGGTPTQGPAPSRGLAIAALVLGILAVLGSWIPVLNIGAIVLAIIGIVLGIMALVQAKRGTAAGRGMALFGTVLSVVAIILAIVVNVFLVSTLEEQAPAIQQELERQLEEQGYSDEEIEELLGNG